MEDGEIDERMATEEERTSAPRARKMEKSPYDLLKESKSSVEEIVSKMLLIKKEGMSKSEIRELLTQMFLNFVTLRQVNRNILLEEDRVKADTERAKAPVDFTTLQLHNLMYEKSHYVKAIKACKDFRSKYPAIELVPKEEFLRDAPDDIKSQTLSGDASHDVMLKRLNYELYQRKELCELRGRLEQQKKSLLETIANRKKFLSSLPSHLKSLKKASLPVQNQLGFQHTKKLKQHHSAELLPPPLYVLYSQFLAQKEAFEESIDLEIGGSIKEAQAFARQLANKDAGVWADIENSRAEDDGIDDEDDGQRRRKRPNKGLSKDGYEQAGLYQVHPLKIIVNIYDNEAPDPKSVKLMSLKFEFLIRLNVICVGIEGSQEDPETNILCNLFPDDTGHELPHQAAKLIFGDAEAFDASRTSRPFKWAQHLAGIDILPEVLPSLTSRESPSHEMAKSDSVSVSGLALYRQQNRVPTVLQRIRSRKKAQMALVKQLDSLMKLDLPSLNSKDLPWTLHHPACTLHSWSAMCPSTRQASSARRSNVDQAEDHMDVDTSGRLALSKEELEGAREDGELPSLVTNTSAMNDASFTPQRKADADHSRQMAMISKNLLSPVSKGKHHSFRKYDDDMDLILEIDSDMDETSQTELVEENGTLADEVAENFWMDYGAREFCLTLSRKVKSDGKSLKLEAKIKITMEYPIRPPFFTLSLHTLGKDSNERADAEAYNELRAMEAEVNLFMIKMVTLDQENLILAHQVRCLAMLFDYFMDGTSAASRLKDTSVLDVGLCAPVSGKLVARSIRGRDRRKMISWKESGCSSGYPC